MNMCEMNSLSYYAQRKISDIIAVLHSQLPRDLDIQVCSSVLQRALSDLQDLDTYHRIYNT